MTCKRVRGENKLKSPEQTLASCLGVVRAYSCRKSKIKASYQWKYLCGLMEALLSRGKHTLNSKKQRDDAEEYSNKQTFNQNRKDKSQALNS